MFEKQRQEWDELDSKKKAMFAAFFVAGLVVLGILIQRNNKEQSAAEQKRLERAAAAEENKPVGESFKLSALPNSNRNQGLEDMHAELQKLKEQIELYKAQGGPNQRLANPQPIPQATGAPDPIDLNKNLPPPAPIGGVDFTLSSSEPKGPSKGTTQTTDEAMKEAPPAPRLKTWASEKKGEADKSAEPKITIPINSALEGVMLTGINARPSGATTGAVGSVTSANNVGAPFVTKIKGDATLPNGWKLSDLGDCFLGGSAIAVLSAERAYAISDTISCVATNGDVYEAPIKAYGVDADGIQGLAGKPVSKQGAILAQAFLTGIASGLGTALTPTAVPGYNSNAGTGSQSYQTPDPNMVARSAVGTGISNAAGQLSRFYLDFAKETFPVIEIIAGTRITWILKESVEFKRTKKVGQK